MIKPSNDISYAREHIGEQCYFANNIEDFDILCSDMVSELESTAVTVDGVPVFLDNNARYFKYFLPCSDVREGVIHSNT